MLKLQPTIKLIEWERITHQPQKLANSWSRVLEISVVITGSHQKLMPTSCPHLLEVRQQLVFFMSWKLRGTIHSQLMYV